MGSIMLQQQSAFADPLSDFPQFAPSDKPGFDKGSITLTKVPSRAHLFSNHRSIRNRDRSKTWQ